MASNLSYLKMYTNQPIGNDKKSISLHCKIKVNYIIAEMFKVYLM